MNPVRFPAQFPPIYWVGEVGEKSQDAPGPQIRALVRPGAPPLAQRRQLQLLASLVSTAATRRTGGKGEEEEELRLARVGTGLRKHGLHPSQFQL